MLAWVVLACGVFSLLFCVPSMVGIPLGFLTGRMARRDLDEMYYGSLDPLGHEQTFKALCRAERGIYLNVIGLVAWPALFTGIALTSALVHYLAQ